MKRSVRLIALSLVLATLVSCEGFNLFSVDVPVEFSATLDLESGTAAPGVKSVSDVDFYDTDTIILSQISEFEQYRSNINEIDINSIIAKVIWINPAVGVEFRQGTIFAIDDLGGPVNFSNPDDWVLGADSTFLFEDVDGSYSAVSDMLMSGDTIIFTVTGQCTVPGMTGELEVTVDANIIASLF